MLDSRYLYSALDAWYKIMEVPSKLIGMTADQLDERIKPAWNKEMFNELPWIATLERSTAVRLRLLQRLTQSYEKPAFGIRSTKVHDKSISVQEQTVFETPFCHLLHFAKSSHVKMPKLLLIAPMAGHYATLLRDTVRDSLPYFDVYVTDWMSARDVPISHGGFDMDSYIGTLMRCYEHLGPDFHIVGICQSGVPAYASVALLEENPNMHHLLPASLTVMGSPIDVRRSPTKVNGYATEHNSDWFEKMALSIVPEGFPGERRLVYPGFMQLMAFLSMNPERHQQSISDAMNHYVDGDFKSEEKIASFYAEYFSVMDMTAEFYLQTLRVVFQEAQLPKGKMVFRGQKVNPATIQRTPIFAVEGELDDICGLGQTKAALDLATHLAKSKKSYLMLEGSGHYGLFNGHRYRETVLPALVKFTSSAAGLRLAA